MMDWDKQYRAGLWDVLKSDQEKDRFLFISSLINRETQILDLGCGEGIFLNFISDRINYYKGVDISAYAIQNCTKHENANYEVCDINDYKDTNRYDYIIFNEILYYLEKPLEKIHQFRKLLLDGGTLIVSIFDDNWNKELLKNIAALPEVESIYSIGNDRGTWIIFILS